MSNNKQDLTINEHRTLFLNQNKVGWEDPPQKLLLMNYKCSKKGNTEEIMVDVTAHKYILFPEEKIDELIDIAHICENENARLALGSFIKKISKELK